MDFWITRLGGSEAAGMRQLQSRFLREEGGKWQPFGAELKYFPHAVKSRVDGKVFLVEASVEEDIGDRMVLQTRAPRVFSAAGWLAADKELGVRLKLELVEERRPEILGALATLLEQRLATARDKDAERERIAMLRREAH